MRCFGANAQADPQQVQISLKNMTATTTTKSARLLLQRIAGRFTSVLALSTTPLGTTLASVMRGSGEGMINGNIQYSKKTNTL